MVYPQLKLEIFSHSTINQIIDGIKKKKSEIVAKKNQLITKTIPLKIFVTLNVKISSEVNL